MLIKINIFILILAFMIGSFLKISKRKPTLRDIFLSLNSWIGLFYFMKLNISFTVQLFQKIFQYCNEWIVGHLCKTWVNDNTFENFDYLQYTPKLLRDILEQKLTLLRIWAESQGLEEAFDDQFQTAYEVILFIIFINF